MCCAMVALDGFGKAASPLQLPGVSTATLARFNATLERPPDGSTDSVVSQSQAEASALAAAPRGKYAASVEGAALAWVAGPLQQPHRNLVCWVISLSTDIAWPGPCGGVNPTVSWGAPPTVTSLVILVDAYSGEALEMMTTGTKKG